MTSIKEGISVAKMTADTVARFLSEGWAVAGFSDPRDGVSAIAADPDGRVRSALPVDGHKFGMALEVGGRAMNLLFPSGASLCAHGLVKEQEDRYGKVHGPCPCGLEPVAPNPPRGA